ncbi:MAG: hypothetical protein ABSD59_11515 [Terracidiphilus sp.]|jgi:hypothetical protein
MRFSPIAAVIFLASASAFAQLPNPSALAQLPGGTLADNIYSNDALGVTFHVPTGWTANLDNGNSFFFGNDPNALANRCTRVLMRYQAPRKVKGWFIAWGVLVAIDPVCLGAGPFPVSADISYSAQVNDFAEKIYRFYHPAPFFPPGGVDVSANVPQGRQGPLTVTLMGKGVRDIDESDPTTKRTPVPISTRFSITPTPKFWVAWAQMADDRSNAELMRDAGLDVSAN